MKTIIIFAVMFLAHTYFKKRKAEKRTKKALETNDILMYPAKQNDMYIVRDTITKNIFAIVKDLYDGRREYIVFGDTQDRDKVTSIVIDDKNSIVCRCFVYEDGSLNAERVDGDFFDTVESMHFLDNESLLPGEYERIMMIKKCCDNRKNIQEHEWFQSKTGDTYKVYG
jgi:hypothetical protein